MKELKLSKDRARHIIKFKPDKDDDWFIYIIHSEKKSGKETSKVMIIKKDVDSFLESLKNNGWKEIKDEGKK
jgi:hypothetical protein